MNGQIVADSLAAWLADTVKRHLAPKTYCAYEPAVRPYLTPRSVALASANHPPCAADAQRLYVRGLTQNSVRNIRAVLRVALNVAFHDGPIDHNPAASANVSGTVAKQTIALTETQVVAFLNATRAHRLHPHWAVALSLGCGRAECSPDLARGRSRHWHDQDAPAGPVIRKDPTAHPPDPTTRMRCRCPRTAHIDVAAQPAFSTERVLSWPFSPSEPRVSMHRTRVPEFGAGGVNGQDSPSTGALTCVVLERCHLVYPSR